MPHPTPAPHTKPKNRLCEILRITADEYNTMYMAIEQAMTSSSTLGRSLKTRAAKETLRYITAQITTQFASTFERVHNNEWQSIVTQFARRCNHNTTRRVRHSRGAHGMGLQDASSAAAEHTAPLVVASPTPISTLLTIFLYNTNGRDSVLVRTKRLRKSEAAHMADSIDNLSFELFMHVLLKDIGFCRGADSLFYYMESKGDWTRMPVSTETQWHSALEDMHARGSDRPTFVIESATPPPDTPALG